MASDDNEYSNLPSWMKKKGYADAEKPDQFGSNKKSSFEKKGTEQQKQSYPQMPINPQSFNEQHYQKYQQPFQPPQPYSFPKQPEGPMNYGYEEKSSQGIPIIYNVLILLSLVIAIVALYFAWSANTYVESFKAKIRGLAAEVSQIQDSEIELTIKDAAYKATVKKNVPLRSFFTDSFGIPVELNIPINKRLNAYTTTGIPTSIDVKDTLTIKDVAKVDPSAINKDIYITLEADLRGTAPIVGKVRLKDLYGDRLINITNELAALGK